MTLVRTFYGEGEVIFQVCSLSYTTSQENLDQKCLTFSTLIVKLPILFLILSVRKDFT